MAILVSGRSALQSISILAALAVGSVQAQQQTEMHQLDDEVSFSSVEREYQNMDAEFARTGIKSDLDDIETIHPGQSRERLIETLGKPALEYGDGSVEYNLSLPVNARDEIICQYRVFFDGDNKVEEGVWRRPQCADLVLGQAQ